MQRYEGVVGGGDYKVVGLYVANGGRKWRWSSQLRLARGKKEEGNGKMLNWLVHSYQTSPFLSTKLLYYPMHHLQAYPFSRIMP